MNQTIQPHSGAWVTFTYGSFAASAFLVAIGVFFLPIDLWMKGYLTMACQNAISAAPSSGGPLAPRHDPTTQSTDCSIQVGAAS